jgi:hypothetical protein
MLDDLAATAVAIVQTPDGLMVRARVPADGIDGGTRPLDRLFGSEALLAAAVDAAKARGTHRHAGPLEHDLRLIGRHVAIGRLDEVVIAQSGDAWMVRHRDTGHGGMVTEHIDRARLIVMEAHAIMARRQTAEVSAG